MIKKAQRTNSYSILVEVGLVNDFLRRIESIHVDSSRTAEEVSPLTDTTLTEFVNSQ